MPDEQSGTRQVEKAVGKGRNPLQGSEEPSQGIPQDTFPQFGFHLFPVPEALLSMGHRRILPSLQDQVNSSLDRLDRIPFFS
jgi:hypothetical protein